jgi:T5SS/PEP-CTERM-associated repeat protein
VIASTLVEVAISSEKKGEIIVQGAGSQLDFRDRVFFGRNGDASLLIQNGGTVTAREVNARSASQFAASASRIRVRGGGSRFAADSLTMDGSGTSTLLEVTAGAHASFKQALVLGNAALDISGGSIDVGTLAGLPETDFVRVGLFGLFSSSGPVKNVHNYFGSVSVGNSPGVMMVEGAYLQEPGSSIRFSIAGTEPGGEYSQLAVGGNLQLAGTIHLSFEEGFSPQQGETFELITVGGAAQVGALEFEIENLAPGFMYDFAPFAGGYRLTALNDGQFTPPGDFNSDGAVDAGDLALWRSGFGATGSATRMQGDADSDEDVDGADFLAWQRHLGSVPAIAATAVVPEPATFLLFIVASAGFRRTAGHNRKNSLMSETRH